MILALTFHSDLKGKNATNYPGVIRIKKDLPYYAAVWAQEAYESTWKLNPFNTMSFLVSERTRRDLELMGHMIEVLVKDELYKLPFKEALRAEALSMKNGDSYDPMFDDYSVEEIEEGMRKFINPAQEWVDDNWKAIRKRK